MGSSGDSRAMGREGKGMIRFLSDKVILKLSAAFYSRESLQAATQVLDSWIHVSLSRGAGSYEAILYHPARVPRHVQMAVVGTFLNEALSHQYRQKVVRFNRALTQPVLAQVFKKKFIAASPDPVAELEPQIAEDRRRETAQLLEAAKSKLFPAS